MALPPRWWAVSVFVQDYPYPVLTEATIQELCSVLSQVGCVTHDTIYSEHNAIYLGYFDRDFAMDTRQKAEGQLVGGFTTIVCIWQKDPNRQPYMLPPKDIANASKQVLFETQQKQAKDIERKRQDRAEWFNNNFPPLSAGTTKPTKPIKPT